MTLNLDELERIGKAATPGPWKLTDRDSVPPDMKWIFDPEWKDGGDVAWVVAARNNWQAMIDELRELRQVKQLYDKLPKTMPEFSYTKWREEYERKLL